MEIKVVLVDTTRSVDPNTMAAAAAAINVQVTRDLPQFWNIQAAVSYLPNAHSVPQGMWPVQLVRSLPPGEGGFHQTKHHQPYAKVIVTPDSNEWTIDASHEILEMLVDPYGNKLQASTAIGIAGGQIRDGVGKFEYLVEACDPCEANDYAYMIDGISVSDFLTPHFYDLNPAPGARYSFTGAIKSPREILPGGYISWVNPEADEVQQIRWLDPNGAPELLNLGPVPPGLSLRAFVEQKTFHEVRNKRVVPKPHVLDERRAYRQRLEAVGEMRARYYK